MNRLRTLLIATSLAALPMISTAQTANTPGGSAATGTGLDQTKGSPQKSTAKTTQTAPDATNPSGSLPAKGSTPAASGTSSTTDGTTTARSNRRSMKKPDTPKAGAVPSYPAPAPDGTPTK